jgi:hypothetical protein
VLHSWSNDNAREKLRSITSEVIASSTAAIQHLPTATFDAGRGTGKEIIMQSTTLTFLRRILWLDALSAAVMGAMLLTLGTRLADWFALPQWLLREAGIVLLPFAALVAYLASRSSPSRFGVGAVIAVNAIWTIDSIALLFTDWVAPSALGYAFVVGQALVVGLFAELQYAGLRRTAAVPAAQ